MSYPLFLARLLFRTGIARWLPRLRPKADGSDSFWHHYSDRVLGAPHVELQEAMAFLEPNGAEAIDLAMGSPRFDLVPSGSTKLPADRRGCPPPWGFPELKAAVAEKLQADHDLVCHPADEVLITPGAAGAFHTALEAFVNPGDPVVLFDPTSPLYRFSLRQRRARIRWIPTWMEDGRTRFYMEHLVKSLGRARLIVVNSPANPTGGVLAPEDLEQIAWWANQKDVLILSDEVFERFQFEGERVSIGTLPKARHRTITIGSLSKGHALAAARVGWLAGHRHLIRACATTALLQPPFVPTLCQQMALSALRLEAGPFQAIRAEFDSRRRYVMNRLEGLDLQAAWPAGAFFFWVPVWDLGLSGRAFAERLLRTRKVRVCPGDLFGPSGMGYVRLSYAIEEGRLREGIGRLTDFVRELRPSTQVEVMKRAA